MSRDLETAELLKTLIENAAAASQLGSREIAVILDFAPQYNVEQITQTRVYIFPATSAFQQIARGKWAQTGHELGLAVLAKIQGASGDSVYQQSKDFVAWCDDLIRWISLQKLPSPLVAAEQDERIDREQLRGKKQLLAEYVLRFGFDQ